MALVEKTTIKENLDLICLKKKKKVTLNKIKKMTEDKKKNQTGVRMFAEVLILLFLFQHWSRTRA